MDVKVYSADGGKTIGGEMSLEEKRMCLMIAGERPELPYPLKVLQCADGTVQQVYDIPEADKAKVACLKWKNTHTKTKLEIAQLKGESTDGLLDELRKKFVEIVTYNTPLAEVFPSVCYPVKITDCGGPLATDDEANWTLIGEDGNVFVPEAE